MHISHDIAICHIFNTEYRGFLTSIFQDDIKRDNFLFIQPISQTTLNVGPPYSRTHWLEIPHTHSTGDPNQQQQRETDRKETKEIGARKEHSFMYSVYVYIYTFIIQASVYDTNKIIHSVKIVRQLWTKVRLFILNNVQIFRHMTKTVTSFIVNVQKSWISCWGSLYTVRK